MKKLRYRCPICGMMPELDRLTEQIDQVRLYLQEFGGRGESQFVEGKDGVPKRRPMGKMKYTDISDQEGEKLSEIVAILWDKCQDFINSTKTAP